MGLGWTSGVTAHMTSLSVFINFTGESTSCFTFTAKSISMEGLVIVVVLTELKGESHIDVVEDEMSSGSILISMSQSGKPWFDFSSQKDGRSVETLFCESSSSEITGVSPEDDTSGVWIALSKLSEEPASDAGDLDLGEGFDRVDSGETWIFLDRSDDVGEPQESLDLESDVKEDEYPSSD